MKKQKLLLFCSVFVLSFLGLAFLTNQSAFAETKTWDGSAADNKFATGANWSGNTAPINGDTLVFPADTGLDWNEPFINDIDNLSVAGIEFTQESECPDRKYFTIVNEGSSSTDDLTITGDIDFSAVSDEYCSIDLQLHTNVALGASIEVINSSASASLITIGNATGVGALSTFNLGAHDFTSNAQVYMHATTLGSGDLNFSHYTVFRAIQEGTGSVTLSGDRHTLTVASVSPTALNSFSSVTINGNNTMTFSVQQAEGNHTITVPIRLNGNGYEYVGQDSLKYRHASLSLGLYGYYGEGTPSNIKISKVTLGADATYDSNAAPKSKVTISNLVKNGHKLTRVNGSGGKLIANGKSIESNYKVENWDNDDDYDSSHSIYDKLRRNYNGKTIFNITVLDGGIVGGKGTVRNVTVKSGGTIAPGKSPGVLTTGDLEFEKGGIYDFEMAGTKPGKYDQIKVNGSVTLGNGTLNVDAIDGFTPKVGSKFTIINNNGSDKVNGRFKGLAEGAVFTDDGIQFRISYKGGSGNDVVLTVLSVVDAPDTGSATFTNNPLAIILATIVCSGAIAFIASRYNKGAPVA